MAGGKHLKKKNAVNIKAVIIVCALVCLIGAGIACVILFVPGGTDDAAPDTGQSDIQNVTEDGEKLPEEDEVPVTPPVEKEDDEENAPAYTGPVNPLTGLPAEEDVSQNRPYAVMINNIKTAVPSAGVSKADMIYEVVVEGGLTRLMAVYQELDEVDVVGSVRSSRPYFLDLAQGLDAVYIHAGGSDAAYTQIKSRSVTNIDGVNGSGETFFRDSWRKNNMGYEHSLMLDPELVAAYMEKNSLRTGHNDGWECNMVFSDAPAPDGDTAENVKVKFSGSKSTSFEYDSGSGLYTVSQYGTTMVDSDVDVNVTAKNVIVLFAKTSVLDSVGRLSITLTGSGTGYFICEGKYTAIDWTKDSYTSQFVYTLEDGTPIEFGRGTSYICVTPTGSEIDIE